jgi:hypothetical protein
MCCSTYAQASSLPLHHLGHDDRICNHRLREGYHCRPIEALGYVESLATESTGNGFEGKRSEKKHWIVPSTDEKASERRKPGKRGLRRGESGRKISNIGSIKVTFRYAISNSVIKYRRNRDLQLVHSFWKCSGSTGHKFSRSSFSIPLEHHLFYFGLGPLDPTTLCNITSIGPLYRFESSQSTLKGVLISQWGSSCLSQ